MLTPEELSNRTYKLAVIDADSLIFKAACTGIETTYRLYNSNNDHMGDFKNATECKNHIKDMSEIMDIDTSDWRVDKVDTDRGLDHCTKVLHSLMKTLTKEIKADKHRFFIGRGETFRQTSATLVEYKGNRKDMVKPVYLDAVKSYMATLPNVTVIESVEADDAVSVMLYHDFLKNGDNPQTVLSHIDKDLNNTAGAHHSYNSFEWYWVTEAEADYNFALQMLTGDKTDNILGLPNVDDSFREKYGLPKRKGVGKATAEAILKDLKGQPLPVLYERVLGAYMSHYGTEGFIYKSWDGQEMSKTAEEILDENCDLIFMHRKKDEHWIDYKKRTFK